MPKARPQPRKFGLRSSSHHTASDSGATSKRNLEKIDRSSAENTSKPTNGQPPVAGTILVDPPVDPAPDDNQLAASNAPAAELKPETPTTMAVPISQSADNADPLATSGAATKPVPSFQGTPEVMDPHGDLIIVTGNSDVGFRVCSRTLARSSSVLGTLLFACPREGQRQQTGDLWEVPLQGDNSDAFRVILQVIHSRFEAVPKLLTRDSLFQVTVLTNKYNMAVSLRPFWRDWYSSLPPLDEYESPEALIHALLIAWEIGERDGYIKCLGQLVIRTWKSSSSGRLYFPRSRDSDFHRTGDYDIHQDVYLRSLHLLDRIAFARCFLIGRILQKITDLIHIDRNAPIKPLGCHAPCEVWRQTCKFAMFGALYQSLHHEYLMYNSVLHHPAAIEYSVRSCVAAMENVRANTIGWSGVRKSEGYQHQSCTPFQKFTLNDVLQEHKIEHLISVDEDHFKRQASKSGILDKAYPMEPTTIAQPHATPAVANKSSSTS